MGQRGFWDEQQRVAKLKEKKPVLQRLSESIPWDSYRLLKLATPGAFTFILDASKEVPRRVSHPSRKSIGLRVPDHRVIHALLAEHGQPLLATTLILPNAEAPLNDAEEIHAHLASELAGVIDAGACAGTPTTVIDLTPMRTGEAPDIMRKGAGDWTSLGL